MGSHRCVFFGARGGLCTGKNREVHDLGEVEEGAGVLTVEAKRPMVA